MNPVVIHKSTKIKDLLVIQPQAHADIRGSNFEAYNKEAYDAFFPRKIDFKVDSYARSVKNVLRGLHGDNVNWKLIEVLYGSVFFAVVDVATKAREEIVLSANNRLQVFLPPGCVNGHCVISDEALFHYRLSHGFTSQADQLSFKWNDPSLGILWPTQSPILSKRDE
jgi:dTDP-4-dehydrorhamnose 3,5-epimerase